MERREKTLMRRGREGRKENKRIHRKNKIKGKREMGKPRERKNRDRKREKGKILKNKGQNINKKSDKGKEPQ